MPTKSARHKADQKAVVHFYLADDLRQEVNGKVSAIGLYTDRVVVIGMPDDAPEPTEKSPLFLRSLAFVFNISGFTEPLNIGIRRVTKTGAKPLVLTKEYPPPGEGNSLNLLAMMEPCAIGALGKKKIVVSVGDTDYEFEYEIRRASLPKITPDKAHQPAHKAAKAATKRARSMTAKKR